MKVFAIVGGGRWARVYLSVLYTLNIPYKLVIVSKSNLENLASFSDYERQGVTVVATLKDLFKSYDVGVALIVNAAPLHFEAAYQMLELGVPVLIEKPLALYVSDVNRLFELALKFETHVFPALTFSHCSYLKNFYRVIKTFSEKPISIELNWSDALTEVRYGEAKVYDSGISVVQDVMPHVWTVLSEVLGMPNELAAIESCDIARGGRYAKFNIVFSGVFCEVTLEREAKSRRRSIIVNFESGRKLEIDFAIEPGVITNGSLKYSGDPEWNCTEKPLRRQLEAFLELLKIPFDAEHELKKNLLLVSLIEESDLQLKRAQKSWLIDNSCRLIDSDILYAVGELVVKNLYKNFKILPGDNSTLQSHILANINKLRAKIR